DERLARDLERREQRLGGLGARQVTEAPPVDDDDLVVAGPVGQRRVQRELHHLLGCALAVAAGLGTEGDATSLPVRGAGRAGTGASGALLLPRLGATPAHLGARLGGL